MKKIINEVIENIKENASLYIVGIIVVSLILINAIVMNVKGSKTYNDSYEQSTEEIPMVNHTYEANEYKVLSMTDEKVMKLYYNDFIRMMCNDVDNSWNYLSNLMKEKYNNDINVYKKAVASIVTKNTITSGIKKYKITTESNRKTIKIITDEGIEIEFSDDGVWNYTITRIELL